MSPPARRLAIAALLSLGVPGAVAAQRATIIGRIVVHGGDVGVGYAVVSAAPGGSERFTGSDGTFALAGLPTGRLTISARHIGYVPLDTVIAASPGDTVRLRLELSLITIQLPRMYSLAKVCAHPGGSSAQVGAELMVLFEQVKENAERNRLLSRSYPFELAIERKVTMPEPALLARFVAYDTVLQSSEREWRYAPGKMLGTREYAGGAFGGKWLTVTMPELADFADERFLVNHCFDYGGIDVLNGDSLLRIDFVPAPSVHDPDVAGTIYLERKTYQLRATELSLVNLTKELRERTSGQSIRADFTEVIPGVPVVNAVSSVVFPRERPKGPPEEPATENHRILSVRFLRGRP